jgi:Sec-independent protein secretion pathway component TatC
VDGRQERAARTRDAAAVLPFLAALLLTPPVILIFAKLAAPWGVPLIVLYVFAVWAATILAGFLLARRLKEAPGPHPPDGER